MPAISIITTTYQRPRALDRVLASLAAQGTPPLEVLIADDGSGEETARVIREWQAHYPCPLRHIWQEDRGFRAAKARNRAAAAAQGNYLVFLDGDCLVFPDFVQQHLALAEAGWLVMGSRILCAPELTEHIENNAADPLSWHWKDWLLAHSRHAVNRIFPLLRLPGNAWRKRRSTRWKGVRTFNLALWRTDFERVNGFDESFEGWGHEDADLAVRLMSAGVRRKDGQFALPVLHLWHRESSRGQEAENMRRLQARLADGKIRADIGLDQYRIPHETA